MLWGAGCVSTPENLASTSAVDQPVGTVCAGGVMPPPAGLSEVTDPALLETALGAAGQGKLCAGKVFVVEQPVTVYRVWDSAKSYTALGRWWSFELPEGPKSDYRKDNDICPAWSALNQMSSCRLKVGAKIVVGPGQSAQCKCFKYPKSAVNQVFIPNDTRNHHVDVEFCTSGVDWP